MAVRRALALSGGRARWAALSRSSESLYGVILVFLWCLILKEIMPVRVGVAEKQAFCRLDVKKAAHGLHWYIHGNIGDTSVFKHGCLNVHSKPYCYL